MQSPQISPPYFLLWSHFQSELFVSCRCAAAGADADHDPGPGHGGGTGLQPGVRAAGARSERDDGEAASQATVHQ